jgi:hypothetical protein
MDHERWSDVLRRDPRLVVGDDVFSFMLIGVSLSVSVLCIANVTFSSAWLGATTSRSPSGLLERWS